VGGGGGGGGGGGAGAGVGFNSGVGVVMSVGVELADLRRGMFCRFGRSEEADLRRQMCWQI